MMDLIESKEKWEEKMVSNEILRRAEELYSRACDKKALGEFDPAIRLFKEALDLNPDYVEALNNLGNMYSSRGEYKIALVCFEKALELNSGEPILLNNAGICYMECKNFDTAFECYSEAIRINPNFFPAHSNLGKLYLLKSDPKSAKECFERALQINPTYVDARIKLKGINQLLEMSGTGGKEELDMMNKEYYEKKKDLILDSLLHKANTYFINQQFGDAAYNFQKALELQPNSVEALSGLSSLYLALKEYNKAIEHSDKVLAIDLNNKEAYFYKGSANFYLKKITEAILSIIKFLSLADSGRDETDGNYLIGVCYFEKGDIKNSIRHLEKIKNCSSQIDDEIFFALANAYYADGKESEGNKYMYKAAEAGNNEAIDWTLKKQVNGLFLSNRLSGSGFNKFKSNNLFEALKDFNQAVQINPQNHLAYYRRALIHLNRGDISFAIKDLDRAIEVQEDNEEYYFSRGYSKMKLGIRNEAKLDLQEAVKRGHSEAKSLLNTHFRDESNELENLMRNSIHYYNNKDINSAIQNLEKIYNHFSQFPKVIKNIERNDILSDVFYLMVKLGITEDDDINNLQVISGMGYLITSLAIEKYLENNLQLLRNRIIIMRKADEALNYSIRTAFKMKGFDPYFEARDILWTMEIHDLNVDKKLLEKYNAFNKWVEEYDENIAQGQFHPHNTKEAVIQLGLKNHSIFYEFLKTKILMRGDLDFDKL